MRILWLYGPPGVGKSTTAWEGLNILANAGEATAYVDIDQLGMVYPAPSDDPYAERVAGRALGAVAPEYERMGAETLVVSGVLNPALMPFYRQVLSSFAVAFVRLTVDETKLKERTDARGADAEEWDSVLEEARAYEDAGLDHPVVVAQGATPTEVARSAIAAATTAAPDRATRDSPGHRKPAVPDHDAGEAILLGGTRAVGKSTIAWEAFMTMRRDGTTTAFLDLRQLGFFGPDGGPVDHRLQTATLKAIWPVLRAAGAQLLLLNGSVDDPEQIEEYRASLGATPLTSYRLTADENALAERVRARGQGDSARLAGDTLIGLSQAEAQAIVTQALLDQERADANSSDPVLDTSDLSVQAAAHRVLGRNR